MKRFILKVITLIDYGYHLMYYQLRKTVWNRLFRYFLMLKARASVDLFENYFIDIRLTKCDRGHKRSSKQREEGTLRHMSILHLSNKTIV